MTGAPYTNPAGPPPTTSRGFLRSALSLVLVIGVLLAGIWWFVRGSPRQTRASVKAEKPVAGPWKKASVYPAQEEPKAAEIKPSTDTTDARMKALERQMAELMRRVEEWMKKQKTGTAPVKK